MTLTHHTPYSRDLALSDFFVCLFPQMKKVIKVKSFADVEEVKQTKKMAEAPKGIKINKFKPCIE